MLCQAKRFAGHFIRNAADLKHDLLGLDDCDPVFRGAFTGTHTNTERLLGNGLIREDLDPDLTATLGGSGHSDTGCFDLIAGDPAGFQSLDAPLAVADFIAAGGNALHAAALYLAVFGSLRH